MKKRCSHCGAAFECTPGGGPCWCMDLPPLPIVGDIADLRCLCPTCLQDRVRQATATSRVA